LRRQTKALYPEHRHISACKEWGDVLAKQGRMKEALVKYNEALKYAPNWKQAKEACDAAANVRH
jgi:tetratricopeptide (TPR) repeat protein